METDDFLVHGRTSQEIEDHCGRDVAQAQDRRLSLALNRVGAQGIGIDDELFEYSLVYEGHGQW